MDLLRELGFNRLSMGVQDFTPEVQEAIGRGQGYEETVRLYQKSRAAGFDSINLDLVYGLPLQTPAAFRRNLEQVIGLRPDRVAVYSFAYVPWVRGNQKGLDPAAFPSPDVKFELFLRALEASGVGATLRRSKGADIRAACGQLAGKTRQAGT